MSSTSSMQPFLGGDRFATITPDDHGGIVWVVSILCAIFSLLAFLLRCYVKRKYFGLDDWLALAATVAAEAQYIAVFVATFRGLGKSYAGLSTSDIRRIGEAALVGQNFFLLALVLAKISIILLIRRLYSPDMFRHLIFCDGILVICAVWGLSSILTISIDCSPLHLMGLERDFCSNLDTRWKAIGAIDATIEVIAVSMSAVVVWRLQMSMDHKARVVIAFLPRLPIVAFAILHIHYISNFIHDPNTGVALAAALMYEQIELCYSLISCTVPNLKGFLSSFDTGMGFGVGYTSNFSSSQGGSFQLKLFKHSATESKAGASKNAENAEVVGKFRQDPVKYVASVVHANGGAATTERRSSNSREGRSTQSMSSQDMIIRDVRWNVHHD